MATKGGNRAGNGNTRIRFIMLEADGSDIADLQQIAQAITNAVRPTIIQLPPTQTTPALVQNSTHGIEPPAALPSAEIQTPEESHAVPARKAPGNGQKRKLPVPTVLELDLVSGPMPFTRFVQDKKPSDHSKRYLVIAAWLKEHRQLNEISIHHIYTCYRKLNLSVVADVAGVFRGAKKQGWFYAGSEPGMYAINHIGLGLVEEMGGDE